MTIQSGIYKIVNKINGKIYVGSAKKIVPRWRGHKSDLRLNRHHSIKLQRAWDKYGDDNFEFEIIEYVTITDYLTAREQKYIDKFESVKNGYNVCPIANTCLGHRHTKESREKMSKARNGKRFKKQYKNMTEVCRKIGIKESTFYSWSKGKYKIPKMAKLACLYTMNKADIPDFLKL